MSLPFFFLYLLFLIFLYLSIQTIFSNYTLEWNQQVSDFYAVHSFSQSIVSGKYGICQKQAFVWPSNYCISHTFIPSNFHSTINCYFSIDSQQIINAEPKGQCIYRALIVDNDIKIARFCCHV